VRQIENTRKRRLRKKSAGKKLNLERHKDKYWEKYHPTSSKKTKIKTKRQVNIIVSKYLYGQ
jgi:hypothetical protein